MCCFNLVWILSFLLSCLTSVKSSGCNTPPPVKDGYYIPIKDSYEYDSQLIYACDKGYELTGPSRRQCAGLVAFDAFYWTGTEPKCAPIKCVAPVLPKAVYVAPKEPVYGTSFTYVCSSGLVPLGPLTASCQSDGSWEFTQCRTPEYSCDNPVPTVNHAIHNASVMPRYPSGTVIGYRCDAGYRSDDTGTIFCDRTTWSGKLPVCLPIPVTSSVLTSTVIADKNNSAKIELPVIAGVVTAAILTSIFIVIIVCMRRRKYRNYPNKSDSIESSSTTTSSTNDPCITPNQSFRMHRGSNTDASEHNNNNSMSSRPQTPIYLSRNTQPFNPVCAHQFYPAHTPPSRNDMDSFEAEGQLHTIRDCVGEFRQTCNQPTILPAPPMSHTHSCPKLSSHLTLQRTNNLFSSTMDPNTRPPWLMNHYHQVCRTVPYETVICPRHGVEHIYQPLEHVYEEPHIWSQPLPNPHNC